MTAEEKALPEGWVESQIGELCTLINGKAFKPSDWTEHGLPIIRIQNLNKPEARFNYYDGDVEERFIVEDGELLFAWSGTPGTSFGAHIWRGGRAVLNQHIFRVRFDEGNLDKRFFRHAINQRLEELIRIAHGGVGLRHVTKGKFEATSVAIPPLAEQRRIVEKIEALTARSRRARAALEALPALLDRYRASVLAAAFRGDLTKDWRETHSDKSGTAWADEMKALALKMRTSRRNKALLTDETSQTPSLPENWTVAPLASLAWHAGYGTSVKCDFEGNGPPVLRIPNVAGAQINLDDLKRAREQCFSPGDEVRQGDLLVVRTNGSRDLIGRGAVVAEDLPEQYYFASYLIRFRLVPDPDLVRWVNLLWQAPQIRHVVLEHAASSAGQYNVSLSELASFPVPIPPRDEARQIIRVCETALKAAAAQWSVMNQTADRLSTLDQSILAKAFRGELVPQDPTDEPASALLDRIRARRAAEGSAPKRGRRKTA